MKKYTYLVTRLTIYQMPFYLETISRERSVGEGVGGSGRDQPCLQKLNYIAKTRTQACGTGLGSIWVASAWKRTASVAGQSNSVLVTPLCFIKLTALSVIFT
jgi:hypothetical protein